MNQFAKIWFVFVFAALAYACTPNQRILNSSNERPPEPSSINGSAPARPARVEDDIAAMKTADFNFIYVFRRKDGGELDSDDRAFMSANTPYEINRKKISDGGRALVVGSNFRFPPENFKALQDRFAFEDFSKPESEIMPANGNSNSR
ncbi:MAG: hypothetical protein ACJ72Z_03690 [Pyrinomonadaceae bacterium]